MIKVENVPTSIDVKDNDEKYCGDCKYRYSPAQFSTRCHLFLDELEYRGVGIGALRCLSCLKIFGKGTGE